MLVVKCMSHKLPLVARRYYFFSEGFVLQVCAECEFGNSNNGKKKGILIQAR